jgi:hypothetical protein
MANKDAPTQGPSEDLLQPERQSSAKKGFAQTVGDFWQLITALVGLITFVVASITYFATREQLTQSQCKTNLNLIANHYSAQIDQLTIQIRVAQLDQSRVKQGSTDWRTKQAEIEDYRALKKSKIEAYDQTYAEIQQSVCESKPPEKKP